MSLIAKCPACEPDRHSVFRAERFDTQKKPFSFQCESPCLTATRAPASSGMHRVATVHSRPDKALSALRLVSVAPTFQRHRPDQYDNVIKTVLSFLNN